MQNLSTNKFTGNGNEGWPENNPEEITPQNSEVEQGHDIIVIGTSAGGLETLQRLVCALPVDLPAAVFIVIHISPQSPGLLPGILQIAGQLPVSYPQDGEIIEEGHIYVAPPNFHMLLERDIIRIRRGPKENRHRPAIDPLFRSAARSYGPRVVGVILSGMLDDGTAGLAAIKQRGGIAVVQDPADALFAAMPANALRRVKGVDYSPPLDEIAPLLVQLTRTAPLRLPNGETGQALEKLDIEDQFAMADVPDREVLNNIGKPSTIACPECHGVLWEVDDQENLRYRCRVGHAYTAESLIMEHADSLESALWVALRTLEESASLNRRLAERAQNDNRLLTASSFIESAVQSEQHADIIKRVLTANKTLGEETR